MSDTRKARNIALIVASAMFMEQLDGTVISTALPVMGRSFHTAPAFMSLAMTSYLLSLAVFIPASGQIADRYGARLVFRLAIVVFSLSSLACAVAPDFAALILARVVQGMGGAMMVPVGRLILLRAVEKSERIAAMAWLLTPAMLGPVVGPPVGGLIVTYASWRWIFLINIPIGVLGFALVSFYIRDVGEKINRKFDLLGLLISGLALLFFVGGLEATTKRAVPLSDCALAIAASFAFGALYVRHAKRHAAPVLDLGLMRVQTFYASVVAGTLFRVGFAALPFLLPLMLQLGFGLSAAKSGLITFSTAASSMAMKSMSTRILRRFGYRTTLIWNGLFCAAFMAACAAFRPDWPIGLIYLVLIIGGFFRSLQFNSYGSIAYADIEASRMSAATSFNTMVQQLSNSLGIAIAASVLGLTLSFFGHASPGLGDFSTAFVAMAVLSLPATYICLRLPATAGAELTGHKSEGKPAPAG
jgi:EmrB/QacA subfamily drug resistance transporter